MFSCLFPCRKTFKTEQRLRQHYKNRPECKRNWQRRDQRLTQASLERQRQTKVVKSSGAQAQTVSQLSIPSRTPSPHSSNIENRIGAQQLEVQSNVPPPSQDENSALSQPSQQSDPNTTSQILRSPALDHENDSGTHLLVPSGLTPDTGSRPIGNPQLSGATEVDDALMVGAGEQIEEEQQLYNDPLLYDDLQLDEPTSFFNAPAQPVSPQANEDGEGLDDDSSMGTSKADFELWYFEHEMTMDGGTQGDKNPFNDADPEPVDDEGEDNSDEGESEVDPPNDESLGTTHEPLGEYPRFDPCPEDNEEDDPPTIDVFPRAGEVKAMGQSRFSELERAQRVLDAKTVYHPFLDSAEFSLVKWLNGLPLSKIDSFIRLEYVSLMDPHRRC